MKHACCVELIFECLIATNLIACSGISTDPGAALNRLSLESIRVTSTIKPVSPGSSNLMGETSLPTPLPPGLGTPIPMDLPSLVQPPPESSEEGNLPCDHAAPANPMDMSIPDGTIMKPGQRFTKVWRLVNAGSCNWTTEYKLSWFSSSRLGANSTISLINPVSPGQSVDLVVDMQAPQKPGVYQSNWKLENPEGQLFGLGPDGKSPFWVRITVSSPDTNQLLAGTTPTPTQEVILQGSVIIQPGQELDLDTLQIGEGSSADINYSLEETFPRKVASENGSYLGAIQPGFQTGRDCFFYPFSGEPIQINSTSHGFACIITNRGYPGQIQFLQVSPEGSIALEVIIWPIP